MSKSLEEILKDIKYDEDSCLITLDGVEIGQWNDEAHCDYPEDLIWRRDISNFHHKAFKAGFDAAIKAVSDREKKLVEALEKINREELNSQRPGGGYSNSAKISYEALKEFRGGK